MWVRPAAPNKRSVPAHDRLRGDEERRPSLPGHELRHGSDDRPVGPMEAGSVDLTSEYGQLVAEHQDLCIFADVVHTMDAHEPDDAAEESVHEAERHGRQDRWTDAAWSSRRSGCLTLQAANLCSAVDRRGEKLGTPIAPPPITVVDVGDAEIQEDRSGVARFVVDDADVGLVGGGPAAGFMMIQELASLTVQGFSSRTTVPPSTAE